VDASIVDDAGVRDSKRDDSAWVCPVCARSGPSRMISLGKICFQDIAFAIELRGGRVAWELYGVTTEEEKCPFALHSLATIQANTVYRPLKQRRLSFGGHFVLRADAP